MTRCTTEAPSQTANIHETIVLKERMLSMRLQPATRVLDTLYECSNCGLQIKTREAAYINRT